MSIESFSKEPILIEDLDDYVCPCGRDCDIECEYQGDLEDYWNSSNLQDICFQYDTFGYVRIKYEYFQKYFDMPMYELFKVLDGLDQCITDKEFLNHFGIFEYNVSFSHRAYIANMFSNTEFKSILPRVKTFFDSLGYDFWYFMDTATLNFYDGRVLHFKIEELEKVFQWGWDIATVMVGKINDKDMYDYLKDYSEENKNMTDIEEKYTRLLNDWSRMVSRITNAGFIDQFIDLCNFLREFNTECGCTPAQVSIFFKEGCVLMRLDDFIDVIDEAFIEHKLNSLDTIRLAMTYENLKKYNPQ
jgi:hypothetical protein